MKLKAKLVDTAVVEAVDPPSDADFSGKQLDLFRTFLCNGEEQRDRLSNTLDLWDSVPRYSVSRQAMDKERRVRGFLDLMEINFQYRGTSLKAIIQPARVAEKENSPSKDYYPSANEELTEDAFAEGFGASKDEKPAPAKESPAVREKVELKDIEQKLEELLG